MGVRAPSAKPFGYHAGLDGLRAIAIGCVVAAHAFVPYTEGGGQAGVTAFFALSGYLITRLLVAEESRHGSIDLLAFYARRVLRLLPALVVLATVVLLVFALQGHGTQVLATIPVVLLYSANWTMALGGASIAPFQHTWTLAIEEQFYILWPAILLLVLRKYRLSTQLAGAVAIAAVVAFGWRILLFAALPADRQLDRVHYGSDTNAFALLAGCALALAPAPPRGWAATILGTLGLAAIAVATALGHGFQVPTLFNTMGMPALASLGALGVICGVVGGGLRFLGFAPIAYVGRISYGLYLWHWVTPRLLEPVALTEGRSAIAFALALAATVLSFHLVERPALRLKERFRRPVTPALPETMAKVTDAPAGGR